MPRRTLRPILLAALFGGSAVLLLAGRHAPTPPGAAGVCWIQSADGQLEPLDTGIANIETCAARLEVRYLQRGRPVTGAFGGVYVFVDRGAMAAAAPNGPREPLLRPADRARLDGAIRALLARG
jgi:hypothetical protein